MVYGCGIKANQDAAFFDKYILKFQFWELLSQSMMTEFFRTFGLLISSGSLVVESLLKVQMLWAMFFIKKQSMLLPSEWKKELR